MRGKKNEPAYLHHTAEFIATLRGITLDEVADQTTSNFFTLFKGAKPIHV
jgi:TatD DNase family protein